MQARLSAQNIAQKHPGVACRNKPLSFRFGERTRGFVWEMIGGDQFVDLILEVCA